MTITINDGKGSPQAHVFTQEAQQDRASPAEFVNRANANGPDFAERLTAGVTTSTKASVPHMVKYNLIRPIAGTVNGLPAVLGKHKVIITILADRAVSAESDLKDSYVMAANLLDNTVLRGQVTQFAPANA